VVGSWQLMLLAHEVNVRESAMLHVRRAVNALALAHAHSLPRQFRLVSPPWSTGSFGDAGWETRCRTRRGNGTAVEGHVVVNVQRRDGTENQKAPLSTTVTVCCGRLFPSTRMPRYRIMVGVAVATAPTNGI